MIDLVKFSGCLIKVSVKVGGCGYNATEGLHCLELPSPPSEFGISKRLNVIMVFGGSFWFQGWWMYCIRSIWVSYPNHSKSFILSHIPRLTFVSWLGATTSQRFPRWVGRDGVWASKNCKVLEFSSMCRHPPPAAEVGIMTAQQLIKKHRNIENILRLESCCSNL